LNFDGAETPRRFFARETWRKIYTLLLQPCGKSPVYGSMNSIPAGPRSVAIRPVISQVARLTLFAGLLTAWAGCVVEEAPRRPRPPVTVIETVPPPPVVVVREVPPPRAEVVVVKVAPPPVIREVVVERDRPSPRHVWIEGYWVWRGGRHEWIKGRWELPPRPNAVWVAPRWERRGEGYVFIEGVWR
jgi:hypothetical protein